MRTVLRCLRWMLRLNWREAQHDMPGGVVLLAIATPVAVAVCALGGWWCGEQILKAKVPELRARDTLLGLAALVAFFALWGEGADYVTARSARARQRLSHLPLSPTQLYAIPFLEIVNILGLIVVPFALGLSAAVALGGSSLLALVLLVGSALALLCALTASRLVALAVVSIPPRFGGWTLAVLVPILIFTVGARPLGRWLYSTESGPTTDEWPHILTQYLPGETLAREPLLGLAALLGVTLVLVAIDYASYRWFVLRNPGLLFQRATQSGDPARWTRLAEWFDRRSWPSHTPLRALLKKELLWLLRQRSMLLIPLVLVTVGAVCSGGLEILFPLTVLRPHGSFAVDTTLAVLSGTLFAFGALHAATSFPAEDTAMRRILESPLSERHILHLRTLSVLPFTVITWSCAWFLGAIALGPELGAPPWLKWALGPAVVLISATFTAFAGTAIGTLCPKRAPEHPLFSINLLGIGAQLFLSLASLSIGIMGVVGCSVTPVWALLIVLLVPLFGLLAAFLRSEARRRLRTLRLEPW